MKCLIIHNRGHQPVFSDAMLKEIRGMVEMVAPEQTTESLARHPELWEEAEVLFCGWGAPRLDEEVLKRAVNLKLVLFTAGSVKKFLGDAFWDRGIIICSAWQANAIPVAQYTVSQIIACLKDVWRVALRVRREGKYPPRNELRLEGCYGAVIGLVSLGAIGRKVCRYLSVFEDMRVIAWDPFMEAGEAKQLGVELYPLKDVFSLSNVVSLHPPLLPGTRGMIGGELLAMMKPGASLINTSRGGVIKEKEMIQVLQQRKDLTAVLDVTDPEPPEAGSPLYNMENVMLTPHIAGSTGKECLRMGQWMVEELHRYLAGEPLRYSLEREQLKGMA